MLREKSPQARNRSRAIWVLGLTFVRHRARRTCARMWYRRQVRSIPYATMWRRRHARSLWNRQTARSARASIAAFQIRVRSTHPSKPKCPSAAETSSASRAITRNGVRVLGVDSRNAASKRPGDARIAVPYDTSREVQAQARNHLDLLRLPGTAHGTSAIQIVPSCGLLPKGRALSVHPRLRRTANAPHPRPRRTRKPRHPRLRRTLKPPLPRLRHALKPPLLRVRCTPNLPHPRLGRTSIPSLQQPTHQGKRRKRSRAAVRSPSGLPAPTLAPRARGVSSKRTPFRRSSSPRRCLFPPVAKKSPPRSSPIRW